MELSSKACLNSCPGILRTSKSRDRSDLFDTEYDKDLVSKGLFKKELSLAEGFL